MMDNKRIKLYKNQNRNIPETYERYVPQYQLLGVEPEPYRSAIVPPNTPVIKPNEAAARNRSTSIRQPEQDVPQQTWSSVDNVIVDDVFDEENYQVIDNNEFYTAEALGISNDVSDLSGNQSSNLLDVVQDLEIDSFLLLVRGEPICSGPLEEIEDQTRALIFGEHDLCNGEPIPEEDLIVLKKTRIKVGVFLT